MSEGFALKRSVSVPVSAASAPTLAPLPALPVPTKRRRSLSPDASARSKLRECLSECSKKEDFDTALKAVNSFGMPPPYAYNLLLSIASRAQSVKPDVFASAVKVFDNMVEQKVALSEASYASIIRICALADNPGKGAELLNHMKDSGLTPRLRSYAAIVKAYAAIGDVTNTRALFADMVGAKITPSQAEHAALLRALTAKKMPLADSVTHILKEAAADHPVFDEELAAALEASVVGSGGAWACKRVSISRATGVCPETGRTLRALDVTPAQLAFLSTATAGLAGDAPDVAVRVGAFRAWLAARDDYDVLIDGPNVGFFGQNFESGALMYSQIEAVRAHFAAQGKRVLIVIGEKWLGTRSFSDASQRRTMKKRGNFYAMRSRNESHVYASRFAGGGGGGKAHSHPQAQAQATSVKGEGGGGAFKGSQVWCAPGEEEEEGGEDEFEEGEGGSDGESGSSDGSSTIAGRGGFAYTLLEDGLTRNIDVSKVVAVDAASDSLIAGRLIEKWQDADAVYGVPRGFNDDWFWMMAAFSARTPESVLLCSNDYMRDHYNQMMHSPAFAVWRERHQVRFAFCEATDGSRRPARLELAMPPPASLKVQEGLDGATLHVPLSTAATGGVPDMWLAAWRCDLSLGAEGGGSK